VQYFETVSNSLESENVVMDIRFPGAPKMNELYNKEVTNYLEEVLNKKSITRKSTVSRISDSISRANVVNSITDQ